MDGHLEIRLFGGLRILLDGVPLNAFMSAKVPALLVYLAVTGRAQRRDDLAALLWGEMPDADARNNLRQAIANLRRSLDPYLLITRETVELNPETPHFLDVAVFEKLLDTAPALSAEARAGQWQEATDLYAGDFLAGFFVRDAPAFEEWMLAQRARYRELALHALHSVTQLHLDLGACDFAIRDATRLLLMDEWREESHRQLMLALARTGQRSAALAQYKRCRRVLKEELDVEPSAETTALYEQIKAAMAGPRHNLPTSAPDLLGRDLELGAIRRRLAGPSCRLLTLVGPGGAGKTALAMAAAHACLNGYLAGVWLVELASVVSASALPAAIGDALGMAFSGGPLEPQLLDYLRRKELLLVLDNFEHLISPAALDLLCQILKQAPGVKLLVTSRARLNLAAEWLYDVSGLAYPSNDAHSTGATEAYPAIQLFIQRAQRIRPGFGPDRADAAAVERICRMTEGLPLAIELAASWARALSPAEIAAELGRGMASLGSAARDLPERHRSLAAVFEHSWMLLPVQERAILAQLAIFRDGFDRAAAESVAGATRPMLQALVDRSLLRVSGQERYTLHPLVQQFAGEKLAQQSEEIALEARTHHAQHFATLVSRREHDFHGAHDRQALAWMLEEAGNIRGAWDWGVQQADTGLLEPFLESLLSQIAAQAGDFAGAEAHLQRALTVARTTGNRLDTVKTLIQLSELQVTRGNLAAAERSLREAAALGQEIHAENLLVRVAAGLADLAVAAGRHQEGPI